MAFVEMNGKMRILIIDEDASNAQVIKHYLKRIGYSNFVTETSGYEAMHRIRSGTADFVLCRMNLPIMTGIMIFGEMKSDMSIARIPFAIFENRQSKEDMALLTEYGVDGMLSLPFVQKDLAELLSHTWARYIDKTNPEYLFEQARRLFFGKQNADASKLLNALLEKKYQPQRALVGLARIACKNGEFPLARELAEKVVNSHPDDVHGHQALGEIHLAQSNILDAIDSFAKAIELSPKNPYRYEMVGELLSQVQLWGEAEKLYRGALGLGLDFPRLHAGLASALANQSKRKDAIAIYENLLKKNPKNASFLNNLAACHRGEGDNDKAIQTYRMALELEPRNSRIMFNVALVLLKQENVETAKTMLNKAIECDPNFAKAAAKLAELNGTVGKQPQSIDKINSDEEKPQATSLSKSDQERIARVVGKVHDSDLKAHGTVVEIPDSEKQIILAATANQIRNAFHNHAMRIRQMLAGTFDGYAKLISGISVEIVEGLMEVISSTNTTNAQESLNESINRIMQELQFQDEITQLLNALSISYSSLAEKSLTLAASTLDETAKKIPVEEYKKKLLTIDKNSKIINQDQFRSSNLHAIECLEQYGSYLLDEAVKKLTQSTAVLNEGIPHFRGVASEDAIAILIGMTNHYGMIAEHLSVLRQILDFATGSWLHADSYQTAQQVLMIHGKDLRGFWKSIDTLCRTSEERKIVKSAREAAMLKCNKPEPAKPIAS